MYKSARAATVGITLNSDSHGEKGNIPSGDDNETHHVLTLFHPGKSLTQTLVGIRKLLE